MTKDLRQLIQESRQLLPVATPQQKLRLLKLLKQSMRTLEESRSSKPELSENSDYLEEK